VSYSVDILNSAGAKVAALDASECTVRIRQIINGEWSLTLFYVIPQHDSQGFDKSGYLRAWGARVRVIDIDDSTDYQTFVVTSSEESDKEDGTVVLEVSAEEDLLWSMNTEIVEATYDFIDVTPTYALTQILSHSSLALGTCGPTAPITVYISYDTVLAAITKIAKAAGGEYSVSESGSTVSLAAALGSTTKYLHIEPERNLKEIRLLRYSRDVVNKAFGVGGGVPPTTMAGARHVVKSISTDTITVDSNKLVPQDDSWNTDYQIRMKTGTAAGNAYAISDCTAGAANDIVVATGSGAGGVAAGDKFVIEDSGDNEVDFIRAAASIASYGTIEAMHKNPLLRDTVNLLETPSLDGTYGAGLCEDWTKVGAPTVTENTTATYIKYGIKSQRIQSTGDAQGIYQDAVTVATEDYRVTVWVYITSGTIAVTIGSAVLTAKTAVGWNKFDARGTAAGATTRITIHQSGAGTADFYVDAVMLTKDSLDVRNYVDNCDQLLLWHETYDAMINKLEPVVEYVCRFVDLYKMAPNEYPHDGIDLGDTVTITDSRLSLSATAARVKELNWDPFQPERTEHLVSNAI